MEVEAKKVFIFNRLEPSIRKKVQDSADPTEKVSFEGIEYSLYDLRGVINENQREYGEPPISFGPGFNSNYEHYPPLKPTSESIRNIDIDTNLSDSIFKESRLFNPDAAASFGSDIKTSAHNSIWQQKSIGAGIILFGVFEFQTKKDKKDGTYSCSITGISKLNILDFVRGAGFRKRYLKDSNTYLMVRVSDHIIDQVTIDLIRVEAYREMQSIDKIIIALDEETTFTFEKELLHTIYLKNQDQIFNKNFLELMDDFTVPELRDNRDTSFFLFSNCIVKVDKSSTESIPYNKLADLNQCVWKSHIMNRNYKPIQSDDKSEFEKFIDNISNSQTARKNAFKSAIGYLLQNYNGSHMGQAVVCYDETPTDVKNPQGGTGKGLFAQAVANMREVAKIDGKHLKADDKFRFQTVKVTSQVVFIDDLSKDVPFEVFFSCLTDGWTIERKHMDTIKLTPEDSPKMLFSMNTIISGNGSSHKRRMFILEFSDHYSKQILSGNEHPIEDEHGVLFDRISWSAKDWNLFSDFMINCVTYYLQNDLQPYELINVGRNTLIQTTSEDFSEWTEEKDFQPDTYYRTKELFEEYRDRYYGVDADYKQRTFTNNIGKYAAIKGWDFKVVTDAVSKTSEFLFKEKTH
jgi:hypothetical protein